MCSSTVFSIFSGVVGWIIVRLTFELSIVLIAVDMSGQGPEFPQAVSRAKAKRPSQHLRDQFFKSVYASNTCSLTEWRASVSLSSLDLCRQRPTAIHRPHASPIALLPPPTPRKLGTSMSQFFRRASRNITKSLQKRLHIIECAP
jgi:hypothetical protein